MPIQILYELPPALAGGKLSKDNNRTQVIRNLFKSENLRKRFLCLD